MSYFFIMNFIFLRPYSLRYFSCIEVEMIVRHTTVLSCSIKRTEQNRLRVLMYLYHFIYWYMFDCYTIHMWSTCMYINILIKLEGERKTAFFFSVPCLCVLHNCPLYLVSFCFTTLTIVLFSSSLHVGTLAAFFCVPQHPGQSLAQSRQSPNVS